MIIKKSGGRWQLSLLASVVISAFFLNTAYAWQQEYIVDDRYPRCNALWNVRVAYQRYFVATYSK